ncbi:hypothetical protein AUJ17_01700 [Candidatus Micrarchaeota archaeon CG1_02_47_40]|nr:MAG: hypothetical protein AUJ17_01700 [Candidatus Micrarchaeota archaeon CG1_02_47_40]
MNAKKRIKNISAVLSPKSIAVVGASGEPSKIGHVILRNFLEGGFGGKIYAINPNAAEVLGQKCYKSILDVPGKIDSVVIATPSKTVLGIVKECARKKVKGVVVISGGFAEIGNKAEEEEIALVARKADIALIGPNCMGVLNPSLRNDSVFLPMYKMSRPQNGGISFISQSGAVGGCIVDLSARAGVGMANFVSYGNAAAIDECDLLEYLGKDKRTEIIVIYLEGVRDGRRLMKVAGEITKKKPIIALKAGKSSLGAEAAKSHTGSLAGSYLAYKTAFLQSNIIEADNLEELFEFTKIFSQPRAVGKRIAIITNGGGNGVLAADSIEEEGLKLAEFSENTKSVLRGFLPPYANMRNPLDLIGDADNKRYEKALSVLMEDDNVDALVVIVLFQTVAIDSGVVDVIVKNSQMQKKPIIVVATGGEYAQMHRRILDSYGVPTYPSPNSAIRALKKFLQYHSRVQNK